MVEEKKCPTCGWKKVKNRFTRGKQRYKCKNYGCNYTAEGGGYPEDIKRKTIKYYLEGNRFKRIERSLYVSHVSVINWVKQDANEIRKNGICVNFKKI